MLEMGRKAKVPQPPKARQTQRIYLVNMLFWFVRSTEVATTVRMTLSSYVIIVVDDEKDEEKNFVSFLLTCWRQSSILKTRRVSLSLASSSKNFQEEKMRTLPSATCFMLYRRIITPIYFALNETT